MSQAARGLGPAAQWIPDGENDRENFPALFGSHQLPVLFTPVGLLASCVEHVVKQDRCDLSIRVDLDVGEPLFARFKSANRLINQADEVVTGESSGLLEKKRLI